MTESGTLTFDLTDPDAKEAFLTAVKAGAYKGVLWGMDQYLRSNTKYGNHPEEEHDIYQAVREKLHELLEQGEVSL